MVKKRKTAKRGSHKNRTKIKTKTKLGSKTKIGKKSGRNAATILVKADPRLPALIVTGPRSIAIRAMTVYGGCLFKTITALPIADLVPGADYGVLAAGSSVWVERYSGAPPADRYLGGFHFAPGGNAEARAGGDERPAINPFSLWDVNFCPACADPRGMALVDGPRGRFWCDIYLTGAEHVADGTSAFVKTIADGDSPPQRPGTGRFGGFDYEAAEAVMKHHGKGLLALDEFFAAAYGVTEKSTHRGDPKTTGLDAPRTSKYGLMQATGNMWQWGHDGDPDMPRASLFGGSWVSGACAGSRCANVDYWPGDSDGDLGARGRCDHLQLD